MLFRSRGFAVTILSLRPPPPRILDPEAQALLPLVAYPPGGAGSVLREAWRTIRRAPGAALRAHDVVVVDCEQGPVRLGLARSLAADLGAEYLSLAETRAA